MFSRIRPTTFLALGDSYTIGEGVKPFERWPAQLAQQNTFAPPHYLAETGWTTRDLLNAITSASFSPQYDWVSVLIGVNDQYDGLGEDVFQTGLSKILDFAMTKVANPKHVIVLSIPDYSVTPFAQNRAPERIAQEIMRFNRITRATAEAKCTAYCDITPLSLLAADDITLLTEDTLHPSGKMYQQWADKVRAEVIQPGQC